MFPKALALKVKQVRGSFPLSAEFKTFFFQKRFHVLQPENGKLNVSEF